MNFELCVLKKTKSQERAVNALEAEDCFAISFASYLYSLVASIF